MKIELGAGHSHCGADLIGHKGGRCMMSHHYFCSVFAETMLVLSTNPPDIVLWCLRHRSVDLLHLMIFLDASSGVFLRQIPAEKTHTQRRFLHTWWTHVRTHTHTQCHTWAVWHNSVRFRLSLWQTSRIAPAVPVHTECDVQSHLADPTHTHTHTRSTQTCLSL